MSPSLPAARPCWVWSLPAFAIILSLWWYRKKRGSLKTDSGGASETRGDLKSVEFGEESAVDISAAAPVKSEIDRVLVNGDLPKLEISEKVVVAEVKVDKTEEVLPVTVEESTSFVGVDKGIIEQEVELEVEAEEEEVVKGDLKWEKKIPEEEVDEEIVKAIESSVFISQPETGEKELVTLDESKEIEKQETEKTEQTPQSKGSTCGKMDKMKNSTGKKSNESSVGGDLKMADSGNDNTACILEKKLAKLELGNGGRVQVEKEGNDDVTERDSANNSPSEVMLASPSVSGYSDTHSEGSSDSGKGCSEMLTPSRTPASGNSVSGDLPVTSIYEFVIPQHLVGRLIGRYGSYINEIKETTHASIYIKRHPETTKLKICAVEGTQMDIESALDMIRHKFPKKRYPNVTLEQVVIAPEPQLIPLTSESMQLYLVESINNDVLLSSLVTAGHFFLQQPTHPTYLSLSRLNTCMNYCYSEPNQPALPEGVGAGILCAAPVHDGWYRAQITSMDPETQMCDVKFVDYGGYMTMPVSMLRQIRFDFVNLPFQAAECYLASVKPANEDNVWCEKAKNVVEKLTFGKVLQAQVYGYAEDGVPLIYLYTVINDKVVLINEELVNLGLAEWIYPEEIEEGEVVVREGVEEDEEGVIECEIGEESTPVPVAV